MHHLTLISTGGTLEKDYIEAEGAVKNIKSKIVRYLNRLRLPYLKITFQELLNIDSLFMTESHRQQICEAVATAQSQTDSILITHGTDTMTLTGEYLKAHLSPKVPILLTGAMVPLGFENGDGLQNLTESLLAAQLLSPGFYLVFHGRVFSIGKVQKNKEKSCFESVD